ncbi:MAG: hypothetical protein RMM58_12750 [Chloroflexota bacterium]|nr:hypothetical protein [Chloroflexota bacterium]
MTRSSSLALLAMHLQDDLVHPAGTFGPDRIAMRPAVEALLDAAARALAGANCLSSTSRSPTGLAIRTCTIARRSSPPLPLATP